MAGALRIDEDQWRVWAGDREVKLTRTEFRLLAAIAERNGRVVTHRDLNCQVWGSEHVSRGALAMQLSNLRRKLGEDAWSPRFFECVRSVGYRMIPGAMVIGGES